MEKSCGNWDIFIFVFHDVYIQWRFLNCHYSYYYLEKNQKIMNINQKIITKSQNGYPKATQDDIGILFADRSQMLMLLVSLHICNKDCVHTLWSRNTQTRSDPNGCRSITRNDPSLHVHFTQIFACSPYYAIGFLLFVFSFSSFAGQGRVCGDCGELVVDAN